MSADRQRLFNFTWPSSVVPAGRHKLGYRINRELLYLYSAFVPRGRFPNSATNTNALTLAASIEQTPNSMDTKKYRTGLKRFWAAFVDGVVFLPLLLVELWIRKTTNNISILFIWMTFASFIPPIYSVILHYKTGQTIGKWVAGVKVLDINEVRKLTLYQSIYRDSFYLLIALTGLLYYGFVLTRTDGERNVLANYSNFSNMSGFWWTLLEIVTMLTNSKRRALHDFLAKSVVVRTETSS